MRSRRFAVAADESDQLSTLHTVTDLQPGSERIPHVPVLSASPAFLCGVVDHDPLPIPARGADELHSAARARINRGPVVGCEVLPRMKPAITVSERRPETECVTTQRPIARHVRSLRV